MVYEFGARLLQLRKAKNLTQQALVDRAKALDPDLLFGAALLIALLAPANNAARLSALIPVQHGGGSDAGAGGFLPPGLRRSAVRRGAAHRPAGAGQQRRFAPERRRDRRHPPAGAGAACLSGAGRVRAAVRQHYVGKLRRGVPACRRRAACVLQSGFGNAVMRFSYIKAIEKEASR